MRPLPTAAAAALLFAAPLAHAEEAPAPAAPESELTRAVRAAEEAAKAAREAAEASKASAEAVRQALSGKPAEAKAEEQKPEEKKDEAKPEEAKAGEKKEAPWVYNLGVNLISVTGNANAVTAKVLGQVTGKWGLWAASAKGSAAYGQTSVADSANTVITAQNADLALRGDRGFGEHFGAYVTGGAASDHVASIRLQYYGEAGVGITWFEDKDKDADWVRAKLRTDFGFRGTREQRQTYFPNPDDSSRTDATILSPRVTVSFRYALSKTSFFTQDAEVLPDIQTSRNVRASAASLVSAQIDKGIALNLGFKVRYIGVPAPGAKPTDTELGAGVNWTF